MLTVYKAQRFGRDVEIRPELGEERNPLADMLRYDIAFCNPANLSEIVFPIFTGKAGRTTQRITFGRWQSFSTKLVELPECLPEACVEWITFRHPVTPERTDYSQLEPVTMRQYMAETKMRLTSRSR